MESTARKWRALIIEDHEHLAYLLGYMLTREGFDTVLVADGRRAAEHIASSPPPDVVILDLMLPYLDGFELLGLIRAHPAWKSVPVIVLSARSGEADAVRALEAGADDFVRKPYRPRELLARIRRLVAANDDVVAA